MNWLQADRRKRRSDNPSTALRYQLEYTKENAGLSALVLSDAAGIVVAATGKHEICEELGAYAPLISKSMLTMPLPSSLSAQDVAVRPLSLNNRDLFLTSFGGGVARDALLRSSVQGVSRILQAN